MCQSKSLHGKIPNIDAHQTRYHWITRLQYISLDQLGNQWNLVWMPSDFPMVFLLRPAGEVGSASGRASVQSPCARQDLVSCHLGSCWGLGFEVIGWIWRGSDGDVRKLQFSMGKYGEMMMKHEHVGCLCSANPFGQEIMRLYRQPNSTEFYWVPRIVWWFCRQIWPVAVFLFYKILCLLKWGRRKHGAQRESKRPTKGCHMVWLIR